MTTTNLEQQAPVEQRSVNDGRTVSASVTNSLNSDTSVRPASARDESLTRTGNALAFTSASGDPLADIKKELGLSDQPYSQFHQLLGRAQTAYSQQSSGDDAINYWNGGQCRQTDTSDDAVNYRNGQTTDYRNVTEKGPISVESNGQTYVIDQNSCDPASADLARSFAIRDYLANNMHFDPGMIKDKVASAQIDLLKQRYPQQADMIDKANAEWMKRFDGTDNSGGTTDGGEKPRIDQKTFENMLFSDAWKAYAQEGNNPKFWSTLQNMMSADMQKLVDQGSISDKDKQAFNEVFMNAVKDVYKTDGQTSPNNFWHKLEDRVLTDMDKWRKEHGDLPVPPKPDDHIDPPNPNPTPGDGSVAQSRDKLNKSLEANLSPERLERMKEMEKEFEKRGADRVEALVAAGHDRGTAEKEWQDKMKKTYDNLNEMVTSDNPNAPYDKATRAKMAENAMYLFMDPTKENQGQHGTCWIESGINKIGLTNHPDQMARLLKEVTTTGSYTDTEGKTYKIPSNLLQFPGEEKNWTISNADNGLRSPVGAIFDRTASFLEGRTDGGTNGGYPEEMQALMKKITGDKGPSIVQIRDNNLSSSDINRIISSQYQKDMLEYGGVILLGPGHMFDASLVKNNGQWQIIGDNQWGAGNDQVIGRVNDLRNWNVSATREGYTPEEQSKLRIASDTPVGVRSSSTQSAGYNYYYGYGSSQQSEQQASMVLPRHGRQDIIYDDYNPNYKLNVEGGGETVVPTGKSRIRQFDRHEYERKHEEMLHHWQELRRRAGQPVTASRS